MTWWTRLQNWRIGLDHVTLRDPTVTSIIPKTIGGTTAKLLGEDDKFGLHGHPLQRGVTVMILSFRTDMPGQTMQTQRSSLIKVYTVCHSVCIVWSHYSMVEPHSLNFGVITIFFLWWRVYEYLGNLRLLHYTVNISRQTSSKDEAFGCSRDP